MPTTQRVRKAKPVAAALMNDQSESHVEKAVQCLHCADQQVIDEHGKVVIQPHKKALLNRLSRIAGQVNGVSRMVEKDRYCIDILTQISAVQSALDAVSAQLLADHTNGCVRKAVLEDGGEEAITELLKIIKKMR